MERTGTKDHKRRVYLEAAIERINSWKRTWRADKGKKQKIAWLLLWRQS